MHHIAHFNRYRIRQRWWNRLNKSTDSSVVVEGAQRMSAWSFLNKRTCLYAWTSHFDFTLRAHAGMCASLFIYFLDSGNLHKRMHPFCSASLSTNYSRNLYARRFLSVIISSATVSAQNFVSWLASLPPLLAALVIPLSTYCTFSLLGAHHSQGEGNLTQRGRNQITQK